jgi:hypothetical protein
MADALRSLAIRMNVWVRAGANGPTMTDTIPSGIFEILSGIFKDERWRQFKRKRRLYSAKIDGKSYGAVLATRNEGYDKFALNCEEMKRLIAGKGDDKMNAAFVIAADKSGSGHEFRGAVYAEKLNTALASKPTIHGTYGPFWPLDPSDLGLDEEEPF